MADQNYFAPGEYIGDMHYGTAHIINKIRDRVGEDQYLELQAKLLDLHSAEQVRAMEAFLDATRKLFSPGDCYLNKMLVAVDEDTAMYLYDGRYCGIITF